MVKYIKSKIISGQKYIYKYVHKNQLDGDEGLVDFKNKIIYISKDCDDMKLAVYHEDLHALLQERGICDLDLHFEHVIIEAVCAYIKDHCK